MAKTILDKKQVKHVAQLAALKLTAKEVAKFQRQLSEVLDYFVQLKEVNTQGVEPTSQVTGLKNVFKEDKVAPSLSFKEALLGATKKHRGLFRTKAIFDYTGCKANTPLLAAGMSRRSSGQPRLARLGGRRSSAAS